MRTRYENARWRGQDTLIAIVCGLLLAVAAACPAGAHDLTDRQDPNLAGDSGAHAAADAVDVRTSSSQMKMMKRLQRIAKARAKKRRALGLPLHPVEVSDQGVRQRGLLQALGFDVSLTAPNLFEPDSFVREKPPTAAAATMTASGQYQPGPRALAEPRDASFATQGMWSQVIWPQYDTRGPDSAYAGYPGDPNYAVSTDPGYVTGPTGQVPNPPGNTGDVPGNQTIADNPNPRIVPVFEALLPDGKVIYWDWLLSGYFHDNTPQMSTRILLWDPMHPDQKGVRLDVVGANLFCAGYSHLPNGDLFLAGGNANEEFKGLNDTYIYHWRSKTWEKGPDMTRTRWYPSVASLYNGEQMILGGDPPDYPGSNPQGGFPTPEVFSPTFSNPTTTQNYSGGTLRDLTNVAFQGYGIDNDNPPSSRGYPFLVPSVDGRVLYAGYENTPYLVDTTGTGKSQAFSNHDAFYRVNGSFVNYNTGKVLLVGGGTSAKYGDPTQPTIEQKVASCSADEPVESPTNPLCQPLPGEAHAHGATTKPTYIDLLNDNWTGADEGQQGLPGGGIGYYPNAGDMHFNRRFDYSTVLPDGRVVVTGGMENTDPDPGDNPNNDDFNNNLVNPADAVKAAEMWDPTTEQFTTLAAASVAREYHSTALLLPDGRVLTGGGGVCGPCTTNGEHYYNPNFEIYSPPYLFNSDGSLAVRPSITTSTHAEGDAQVLPPVDYNQVFDIAYTPGQDQLGVDRDAQTAALMRLGTPTHSTDTGQRFIPLDFTKDTAHGVLHMSAPLNSYIAPPGYYMLFLFDGHTPSISKMIQIGARLSLHNVRSVVDVFASAAYGGTGQYLGIGSYQMNEGSFANVGTNAVSASKVASQISSVKVAAGYKVTFCTNEDGTGTCQTITSDQSTLGATIDNKIAYAKVERIPAAGDSTAPVVNITGPSDNSQSLVATGTLHFTATDNSGETPVCTLADGQTLLYNLGANAFTVSCQDESGNTGSDTVHVDYSGVDTEPPSILITSPAEGATVGTGSTPLHFTVSDNSNQTIVCDHADGQIVALAVGWNTISVECHDLSSNSSVVSVHINFVPAATTPPIPNPPGLDVKPRIKLASKLKFSAACPSNCNVTSTVTYGAKKIKLKTVKLKPATNTKVTLSLTKKQLKTLRTAKKKMKVWLAIKIVDGYRQSAKFTAQLK